MRINSKLGTQYAAFDGVGAGEGLSIFLSQNADATARYRFVIKAMLGEGLYDVGEIYSSPPSVTNPKGKLSRMIGGAICPGATSWGVEVSAVADSEGNIAAETAEVILASSRCQSPIGASRVGERYAYHANTGTQNFTVLAGMRITGIAGIGLTGGGNIVIAGGDTITVPEGISANLEPGAIIVPNSIIAFTNLDWGIEYLESA